MPSSRIFFPGISCGGLSALFRHSFSVFADKVAVDEELVRLRTHLDAMEEILRGGDAVGRRLDFLIQEMNREVNTTGSKCTDAAVAQTVVDLKCTLEKVREQIQNLE